MLRIPSLMLVLAVITQAGTKAPDPEELRGIWRGPSLCTDRQALPACRDEDAVYEFTRGAKPGTAHWIADKMVNGERQNMGEADATYDAAAHCWKAEVPSPRGKSIWQFTVSGNSLTGTARLLPANETIRRFNLTRQAP